MKHMRRLTVNDPIAEGYNTACLQGVIQVLRPRVLMGCVRIYRFALQEVSTHVSVCLPAYLSNRFS